MNTQEFVEHFIKRCRTKFLKFLFGMIATFVAAALIAFFVFMKFVNIENDNMLYIFGAVLIMCYYLSVFTNVKLCFRSFKNFKKETDINAKYKKLLKEYRKTNNKEAFDQTLAELELKIKEQ